MKTILLSLALLSIGCAPADPLARTWTLRETDPAQVARGVSSGTWTLELHEDSVFRLVQTETFNGLIPPPAPALRACTVTTLTTGAWAHGDDRAVEFTWQHTMRSAHGCTDPTSNASWEDVAVATPATHVWDVRLEDGPTMHVVTVVSGDGPPDGARFWVAP